MTDKSPTITWMDNHLNSKSNTFCGAKWYNATIWLGNGATSSCHHPPAHPIDPEEVKKNPSALHNTLYKKLVRKEMQEGIQTKECDYCWKIENLDKDLVSDRYYKSSIYSEADLQRAFETPWDKDVTPLSLEISFDNNCNFACSYCNAGFSTTWAHDIKKNGPYQDLESDGHLAYASDGAWASPYGPTSVGNPYVDAFWQWWESDLSTTLNELRITGGEATVSPQFWKLIDWYKQNPDCDVALSVNTNLGVKPALLNKLVDASKYIKNFNLFTSNESMQSNAEYIRDGLNWSEWHNNLETILETGEFKLVHCMMTINALCLSSFTQFHDYIVDLRNKYPHKKIEISYNILRFPSFQSITTLPYELRQQKAEEMNAWLLENQHSLFDHEIDGFRRTIEYVTDVENGHDIGGRHSSLSKRQRDFGNFYRQYDKRRNKSFSDSFVNWPDLVKWFNTIETVSIPVARDNSTVFGWGAPIREEVLSNARKDGLIE